MTQITFAPLNDGYFFECSGHSGYAAKGSDIVCAGISAICISLEAMLGVLAAEHSAVIVSSHFADGYMSAEVHYECDAFSKLQLDTVFKMAMEGLFAIEEMYPEYVEINI